MSEYIQPGGGFYGRRLPAKSVYYPAPAAPEQQPQQLGQYGAGGAPLDQQQLPPGTVPVINLPHQLLSFNQEVNAAVPPQLQQQYQQQQYQQPQAALQQPRQQQAYAGGAPTLVNSDYAAAGWASQQYLTPIRVINAPQALSSQQQQAQLAGLVAQSNADLQQAQSEYEQAMAMAQRAAERLGQLNGGGLNTPQAQYSGFGAQAAAATVPGVHLPAVQREQSQVRFGGAQRIPTPTNSSYRFEDAAQGKPAAAPQKFYQQQADSVYIGMPNNLFLAANRPQGGYHYAPQQQAAQAPQQQQQQSAAYRQPSNANLRTARENDLRRMLSEENVRTAILNEGNVIGHVETRYSAAPQQQQKKAAAGGGGGLQAGTSDYHYDDLRGLNSAY